jgi:hypothetical protein
MYVCVCVFFFNKSLLYSMFHYKEQYYMLVYVLLYETYYIHVWLSIYTDFNLFRLILVPYLRSNLARYLSTCYKFSKFIAFMNIWNHFVYLLAKSKLDRGHSEVPAAEDRCNRFHCLQDITSRTTVILKTYMLRRSF